MNRVLVISSVHRETGLASVSELLALLERVRPDVIFLELPSAEFHLYLDGSLECLESQAALRYRDRHPVALVPVDLPPPGQEFVRSVDYMFDSVVEANPEYCRLNYLHGQLVSTRGFAYLNSADSGTLWSAIQQATRATIEELGDSKLNDAYASWTRAHELREAAMMTSVEDYAKKSPFSTGVLLLGLAHRQSILDKLRSRSGEAFQIVRWYFAGIPDGLLRHEGS